MNRLLNYCLVVFFGSAAISFLFYAALIASGKLQKKLPMIEYCANNTDYNDAIFIGASRVQSHINPRIIDSIAGIKSYCLTDNAFGIVEDNMILNKYLQIHPKPKIVFLNIDVNIFFTSGPLNNITDFFPYLTDTVIYNSLSPYKLAYRNKLVAAYLSAQKIFATTDRLKAVSFNLTEIEKSPVGSSLDFKGFSPRILAWGQNAEHDLQNKISATYQGKGFDLLKKMIQTCKLNSIEIIFIYAPILSEAKKNILNYNEIINQVKQIAKDADVPYWDYSFMPLCKSKKYFYNYNHLNYDGALLYSNQLGIDIKNHLELSK